MKFFGWTIEQWAYAKARHESHNAPALTQDQKGMLDLAEWWDSKGWNDPLSDVMPEENMDFTWAQAAIKNAITGKCISQRTQ